MQLLPHMYIAMHSSRLTSQHNISTYHMHVSMHDTMAILIQNEQITFYKNNKLVYQLPFENKVVIVYRIVWIVCMY